MHFFNMNEDKQTEKICNKDFQLSNCADEMVHFYSNSSSHAPPRDFVRAFCQLHLRQEFQFDFSKNEMYVWFYLKKERQWMYKF